MYGCAPSPSGPHFLCPLSQGALPGCPKQVHQQLQCSMFVRCSFGTHTGPLCNRSKTMEHKLPPWDTFLGTAERQRQRQRERERERERETKGFRFWICIQMKFKEWEMELGLSRSVLHRSNYRVFIGKQSLVGECFSCVTLLGKSA